METIKEIKVRIKGKEVLRLQHYRGKPTPAVEELLCTEIEDGYSLSEPKALYTQVRVKEVVGRSIILDNGLMLGAGHALKDWRGSEYLGVAICTIGSPLEDRVAELFVQGEYPAALMLDSVGSAAADSVADYVNHFICQRAKGLSLGVGARLSPGYGKWDLRDQKVLFALLPGEKVGVRLNENCMMIPRKSVSFCVGLGAALDSEQKINPCRHCNMGGCKYRRSVL
ncbi:MAG: hypothetical protein IBX36_00440 [Dehalococcoidia bacterium]|nr:hypothetical protein [Dehalococcoidia bacterium]